MFYSMRKTRVFDPGAMNYAFTDQQLPLLWYIGAGKAHSGHWPVVGPPQMYQEQQEIPIGLAGIVQGQYVSQALVDTRHVG